jgi:hypothetical protein
MSFLSIAQTTQEAVSSLHVHGAAWFRPKQNADYDKVLDDMLWWCQGADEWMDNHHDWLKSKSRHHPVSDDDSEAWMDRYSLNYGGNEHMQEWKGLTAQVAIHCGEFMRGLGVNSMVILLLGLLSFGLVLWKFC